MVPFLSDTLERLLRRIMGYFVTIPALEKAATALALVKLDVTVTGGNCLLTSDIKLPTASKSLFKNVKLTSGQKEIFLKKYHSFMIEIVSKFQERSPLRYAIVRNASSLNPTNMVNEGEASKIKFGGLIDLLFEHKRLTNNEANDAKNQYEDFLATAVGVNKDYFREFEFTNARIDDFFSFYMSGKKNFDQLWKVTIFVCVLSHGQASIERGFNINKEVLVENLRDETMVSQRLVYDQVKATGEKMHNIKIPRELVMSCKLARGQYQQHLDKKQESAATFSETKKWKMKLEEVLTVKRKKVEFEKVITSLKDDIEKSSIEASTKKDFESMKLALDKADAFRDVLKKKEVTAKEHGETILKLEKDFSN